MPNGRRWQLGFVAMESLLWIALVLTMARAPMLGLFLAAGTFIFARKRLDPGLVFKRELLPFAVRGAGLLVLLFIFGIWRRVAPNELATDASVLNRLDYWMAGLTAYGHSSWSGAGEGAARVCWQQWFAPLDSERTSLGFSNSYLEIGFDYGAVALGFLVAAIAYLVLQPLVRRLDFAWHRIAAFSAAATAVIAVCHVFATLAWSPLLLWMEAGVVATGLVCVLRTGFSKRLAGISMVVGLMVAAGGKMAGRQIVGVDGEVPFFRGDGGVDLAARADGKIQLVIVSDPEVFCSGGRAVRRLRQHLGQNYTLAYRDSANFASNEKGWRVLAGGGWRTVSQGAGLFPTALLFPTGYPGALVPATNTVLILPEIDETGFSGAWRRWARKHEVRTFMIRNCGLDAGANGPALAEIINSLVTSK